MSWAIVAVGAVSVGAKVATGISQKNQGKKLAGQTRPEYEIPAEVSQQAAEGLPSEQYAQAMKNIERQQMTALSRSQDRRLGLAAIGGIQANTNNAIGNLDVADAQARVQGVQRLAGYRDKKWQWDKQGKYNQEYGYGMSLLGAGNQNIMSGVDDAGGTIGTLAYLGKFDKKEKKPKTIPDTF